MVLAERILVSLLALSFFDSIRSEEEYDIPLAPYNVKLMCRQGRRFSKAAQATNQCPTSSTSCGYIEFAGEDEKNGNSKTGVYDCVDGGILSEDSGEIDEDLEDRHRQPLYAEMCGATAKCTSLTVDKLNPSFIKYIVQEYDIKLEMLKNTEIRFCCALFHSTLQRLVTSPNYSLPEVAAPPVSCQGKTCAAGAVGCLLHAVHEEEYDDYEEENRRRVRRLALNDYIEDEDDYVNPIELNFEDSDLELITREPPVESTTTSTAKPTLPSLKLPMSLDEVTTSTTSTVRPKTTAATASSKSKTFNKKHHSYEEDEEEEPNQSTHCVYRHLNNEFYRYCLLVHQSRDGDRCYHHQGHTICCCFVAPDKESCDPTEMDLIVPPPPVDGRALPPRVIVTIPPTTTTSTTTTTTTTTTTSTTTSSPTTTEQPSTSTSTPAPTTTEEPTAEPSKYPTLPPQVYRARPIDQIKRRKQSPKKCRVAYVRTKSGSRTRPVLVCTSVNSASPTPLPLLVFSFVSLLQVLFL